jgi:hypothetical protein
MLTSGKNMYAEKLVELDRPLPWCCVHTRTACTTWEAGPTPFKGYLLKKGQQTCSVLVAKKEGLPKTDMSSNKRHKEEKKSVT